MFAVGLKLDGYIDTLAATFVNFIVCFLTVKTVATIKPLCYLATGMTYREACESCNWVYTYHKIKDRKESK
jgi:hypothetical protein